MPEELIITDEEGLIQIAKQIGDTTAEIAPGHAQSTESTFDTSATPVEAETGATGPEATPVKQFDVIGHIRRFIRRFVFFRQPELYEFVAAWIMSTYLTDQFEYVGYLFAYSPEPQSGKSRLLEVLDLLVNKSSGILVSPTEAVLFRTADGQTQLLDEVDAWRNKDELRSVLNAGFRYGGTVARMREEGSDFNVTRFSVYGPRALAGIGTRILDATTRDRTFMLEMVRQKRDEKREQLRVRKLGPEANYLKAEILKWVTANKDRIKRLYDKSSFPYLDKFRDRTVDVTQPLATIIEVAYGDTDWLPSATARLVRAIAITRNEEESAKEHHRVLRQLEQATTSEDPLVGTATEIKEACANLEDAPSVDEISWTLRHYGFAPKNVRKGGAPRMRYTVSRAAISELLARYGDEQIEPFDVQTNIQQTTFASGQNEATDVVGVVGTAHVGRNPIGEPL